MGMPAAELASASEETLRPRLRRAYQTLADAGSHYVVDSVAQVPRVLEDINARMARGERP